MGRKQRKRAPRAARRARVASAKVLLGVLLKKRDQYLSEDERDRQADRMERRRQKLLAMGFSPRAVRHVNEEDQFGKHDPARYTAGVAEAYLEQTSRHFHGVPADATDKKQGRRRKGGTSPDPARFTRYLEV